MYCSSCGTKKENNVCPNCSKKQEKVFIKQDESLGITSMIMGIISIVLAFIINIIVLPFAFFGLILGIINRVTTGKKISGIVLNAISIVISIVVFIIIVFVLATSNRVQDFFKELYNELNYQTSKHYIVGEYSCKNFDGGSLKDYIVTMKLNKDGSFLWAKYGDVNNNYVKGKYTYEKLNKSNYSNEYKYFDVTLDGSEFVEDGELQTEKYKSDYEFGVNNTKSKKEIVLINKATYNMYYCTED